MSGTVTEFRSGCTPSCAPTSAAFDNLTITEITGPTVSFVSTGNPLPVTTVGGAAEGNSVSPRRR